MKGWTASLALAAWLTFAACGAGDDTVEGARGPCAFGGQLTDCPDSERTAVAACWRLVDCGAIPVSYEDPNDPNARRFDWGVCVDFLDGRSADRRRIMINCIAASTCDELRVSGSPGDPNREEIRCIRLGDP
jgi:hypothetical protein